MANLKLTQLSTSEFKFESPISFCLNSYENCMAFNNSSDVIILELMYKCDSISLMPYSIKQIRISQDKPISEIIRPIDLVQIYENSSVQECQELACDIIYTADCSVEPVKAKIIQADIFAINSKKIACVLTNYGCCEFYKKDVVIGDWDKMDINLIKVLLTEVFPEMEPASQIRTLNDLKMFANKYIITCFAVSLHDTKMFLYLGTAAGYIVALKYNETSCKFESYCNIRTSLNYICYLTICNDFVLAGCNQGKILIIKINFVAISLHELDYLWSITDGMSCQKALFTYSEQLRSYIVVFCKTAHVLAFRLDQKGRVESSSTLYTSGVKITGIESINENEFIATTITGAVKHIKIVCLTNEELYCEEQLIDHDFDSSNYQILGVATSASKCLWSFLLYRNKEYQHRSKFSATTAFIVTCKLSSQDSFRTLTNSCFKNMNMVQDLIVTVNLSIFNNLEVDNYMEYFKLENIEFPDKIDDLFLQRLQIKLMVTRMLAVYQIAKYKKLKEQTKIELCILEPALQLMHILGRMAFLKELSLKEIRFTKSQTQSLSCMNLQFNRVLDDITKIEKDEKETTFHNLAEKFVSFLRKEINKINLDMVALCEFVEYCALCNCPLENSYKKCVQDHEIRRCSISCTQIALFQTKYCPHCNTLARNDDEINLKELYKYDECITCIYCRFLLTQDEM